MLTIYNTLSRKKEEFTPLKENKVSMYVCGVTVYDYIHLGHARAYIAFDTIRRYLEYQGFKVTYIQNFTDIDDKIIKRAAESGKHISEITDKFIKAYFEDTKSLNILPASHYPKATEAINDIIALIEKIVSNGYGYEKNGEVFFAVTKFKDYGKLSRRDLSQNEAGARIKINKDKNNPFDFILWKKAKDNEPSWDSPWGKGRPGWHIECSAMSMKELGNTFDIHGGGADLIFPHHENEIAQSESATGCRYAKYWMHNGFVNINNEKMSKSTGNFLTIRDILAKYPGEIIRLFLLGTHYRAPINFELSFLDEAKKRWQKIQETVNRVSLVTLNDQQDIYKYKKDFENALSDDFNAAEALGHIFSLVKYCNKTNSRNAAKLIKELLLIIGLEVKAETLSDIPDQVNTLANQRETARKNKEFDLSDKLRSEILDLGYEIKDTPSGFKLKSI